MKKYLTLALGLAIAMPLLAQLPQTLSFQGYLTSDAGEPITTESGSPLAVSFALYTVSSGGTAVWGPEPQNISVDKGIFSTTLGSTEPLSVLSFDVPYFLQITVDGEDLPRIPVTAGVYSLSALNAENITTNTVNIANGGTDSDNAIDARTNLGLAIGTNVQGFDADLSDLADGSLSGSKIGTGIDAANITTNTLSILNGGTAASSAGIARVNLGLAIGTDVQAFDADLDDLADGSLTGSKVGLGINAANITTNSLAIANGGTAASTAGDARTNLGLAIDSDVQAYDTDLDDLADGSLTGSKVGSGINASNITINSLAIANGGTAANNAGDARTNLGVAIGSDVQAFDADLTDLADGSLTGSKVGTGINASNITTNSLALANGGTGATTASGARTNLSLVPGTNIQAFDDDLTDLADGSLTGSKVGTGISASNVSTGTLADARLEGTVDVTRLNTTGGIHVGGTTNPGTDNLIVDGTLRVGEDGSPSTTLQVVHSNGSPTAGDGLTITGDDGGGTRESWSFYTLPSNGNLILYSGINSRGFFNAGNGAYTQTSDRRIKKNLTPLDGVLKDVIQIPTYTYHFKHQTDNQEKEIGVIAQELKQIFPSFVEYSEPDDMHSVNYAGLSVVAIKAIQEQQEIIESLRSEITALKKQLTNVEMERSGLNKRLNEQEHKIETLFKMLSKISPGSSELILSDIK